MNNPYSLVNKKIWVTGHTGMLGSSLLKQLEKEKHNILIVSKSDLDLRNQAQVDEWVKSKKPDFIFHTAAKVGGILENSQKPAMFISENLQMQTNVITSAYKNSVKRLVFMGSACIYPISKEPIKETDLLGGKLEPTNRSYSVAKISGIELCRAFSEQFGVNYISVQPNNLYGPNDNFEDDSAHVISSLIRKLYFAKINKLENCKIWGTGKPKREFLYVDDLARALILIAEKYNDKDPINVGSGEEINIQKLSSMIKNTIDYKGKLIFDDSFPDGVMRKFLDSTKIKSLGWKPKINLMEGLKRTYLWFLKNKQS